MIERIKQHFMDDDRMLTDRILTLMLSFSIVASSVELILCCILKSSKFLLIEIALLLILSIATGIYVGKTHEYKRGCILFSYLVNIFILPILFVTGGGIYSGKPLLFVGGIIMTFFVLDGLSLVVAVAIQCVWYIFVITFIYYNPSQVLSYFEGEKLLVEYIFCYLIAALIPTVIIWFQTLVYEWQKKNVEDALLSIEHAGDTKSRFLANMSHELRTPMNAIMGMTELVERDDRNHVASEEIATIKEAAYSLLTTINDVLTYSKLNSGKMLLIQVQYHFGKMLQDIIYTISMEIMNRDIDFHAEIDPGIPDILYGDDTRIRQIYQYILFNAIHNADGGRVTLEVSYRTNSKNNSITVFGRISDTGLGFSEEETARIFTSYETYDSRRDSELKKIGLELNICKEMLALMHGNIKVDSILGVGTSVEFQYDCFIVENEPIVKVNSANHFKVLIYIPIGSRKYRWMTLMSEFGIVPDIVVSYSSLDTKLKEKQYTQIFIPDYSYESVKNLLSLYKCEEYTYITTDYQHIYGDFGKCRIIRRPHCSLNMSEVFNNTWEPSKYQDMEAKETFVAPEARVLVIDDNMVNLRVASGLMQKYGIQVSIATSGREALEKIRLDHYHIIFLDQMMPEMDGLQTLAAIRESEDVYYKEVPIICMTANIGAEVREGLLKAGFQEYLAKPVKIRYLESILRTYLDSKLILQKQKKKEEKHEEQSKAQDIEPGLQTKRGLMQIGGDEATYAVILNTYYREGQEKLKSIPDQFQQKDMSLFTTNVHSVKGSSASIGALEVSELFRKLEMAGRESDLDFIQQSLPESLTKFKELLGDVKQYLIEKNSFEGSEEEENETRELEEFKLEDIEKLKDDLARINIKACEEMIVKMTHSNYGPDINRKVTAIREAFERFDYHKVRNLLDSLF